MTAGLRLSERRANKALVAALADPRVLRRLVQTRAQVDAFANRRSTQVFTNVYGPALYNQLFGYDLD